MARKKHKDKHVEAAIEYAESKGWRVVLNKRGYAWGRLYCPHSDRSGCRQSVWSTPKSGENHAKTLIKLIDKCTCSGGEDAT